MFLWEAGAGLGHTAPHCSVMRVLHERGHELHFAMRDLSQAAAFGVLPVKLYQAPTLVSSPANRIATPISFAEILHNIGFAQSRLLKAMAQAWRNLLTAVEPDVVVVDHSPTALVALRGYPCRKVVIGNGFCCPPAESSPFPALRTCEPSLEDRLTRSEQRVLSTVSDCLQQLGEAPLDRLGQLYAEVDETVLATYPGLDHYSERPNAQYWGVAPPPPGCRPQWPPGERRKVFAYVRPFKSLPQLLDLLRKLELPSLVCSDQIASKLRQDFACPTIQFCDPPVDLNDATRGCSVAILNGSHSTAATALLAGKPVLFFPNTLEQELLARSAQRLGAAVVALPTRTKDVYEQFANLLNNDDLRQAAQAFADRAQELSPDAFDIRVADRLEALL